MQKTKTYAQIPMRTIGPVQLHGPDWSAQVAIPMATYETTLWPSTNRGAKLANLAGGINLTQLQSGMTRSIMVEAPDAMNAARILQQLDENFMQLQTIVRTTSRFAELQNHSWQVIGKTIYLRLSFNTADASGHNMATKAAEAVLSWLLQTYPELRYLSISANTCVDKKNSAINGILGRGKYIIAELKLERQLCERYLRTTPEQILELNWKKNWIGSNIAGGVRTANAHFANMLLAVYLATGQDAANIVEGSQGFVSTEIQANALYFAVTLPNIIVGTVGQGKDLTWIRENLEQLGCLNLPAAEGANRLAMIVAAAVLCGELSLLAAQTNFGELMRAHLAFERKS